MAVAVAGLKKVLMFALAVMTTDPGAIPVTGTATWVPPAGTVTVAGTVARRGSLEVRVTFSPPAGAWLPVRFSVRLPDPPGLMARGLPERFIARGKGTSTTSVRGAMLSASTVIVNVNGTSRLPAVALNAQTKVRP